jgi:flagellin-specific chaperone FliS|tara:strand:+ start:521 stop:907 length:387 start_codon:yes stop_codon:yes gene_type:complete
MEMEKQNITKKVEEKNELSSKERHNIILKLYKGLTDNLEELNKSKDKKGSNASQIAYKVDRIASGLQVTLDFSNEESKSISENFRELYRHIRFAMKMIYEKQEYVLLDSSREIAKTLYQSWAKIKPSI